MDNKINGRTPEEIKKAVECCANPDMRACINCPYDNESCCKKNVDTLAYIQQLEERVVDLNKTSKQLERERDAAVRDMYHAASDGGSFCDICKYKGEPCDERKAADIECWQWRGVQEVE